MINFTFPTRHKFYLGSTLSFKFSFLSRAPPFGACSWLIHLSPRRDTFRERGRWRGRKREIGREKERWRERERGYTPRVWSDLLDLPFWSSFLPTTYRSFNIFHRHCRCLSRKSNSTLFGVFTPSLREPLFQLLYFTCKILLDSL